MDIENFFLKSVGEWNSMRSGHSLAFLEFEEIRSKIKIIPIKINDSRVIKLLEGNLIKRNQIKRPFLINWEAKSEWGYEKEKEASVGESILVPIEISETEGQIIRSIGYSEAIKVISLYKILDQATR